MTGAARVLLLSADLLFASRVEGLLAAAREQVELIGDAARLRARLRDDAAPRAAVLIVDLTDAQLGGEEIVRCLGAEQGGQRSAPKTLGFYSHVDAHARERALDAGFEMVVPRSRMAREGAELVARLAQSEDDGRREQR